MADIELNWIWAVGVAVIAIKEVRFVERCVWALGIKAIDARTIGAAGWLSGNVVRSALTATTDPISHENAVMLQQQNLPFASRANIKLGLPSFVQFYSEVPLFQLKLNYCNSEKEFCFVLFSIRGKHTMFLKVFATYMNVANFCSEISDPFAKIHLFATCRLCP